MAELIIAKNRAGETGIVNLSFNGDLVKFTESSESLYDYAQRGESAKTPRPDASSWDRVSSAVGSYDPFASFGNNDF